MIYHAQPRFTKDVDLFIHSDPKNAKAVHDALADFGASLENLKPEDFANPGNFFRFGHDPHGFDILPDLPGIDFESAWERRVDCVIDAASGQKAFFISANDLIASKLAAGRPQDLADASAVQKAIEAQEKGTR